MLPRGGSGTPPLSGGNDMSKRRHLCPDFILSLSECRFDFGEYHSGWHKSENVKNECSALAFYILSALFIDNFVIIFVVTVLLAALDYWVVKNVSSRILVGLRWWNEINDLDESVWKFESLDQESLARLNKKDSWLFWWSLYLIAVAWIVLGIFSLIRLQADYCLIIGVCLTLRVANIIGFTKCRKDAKKQIQQFASQTIASQVSSTIQSAFNVV